MKAAQCAFNQRTGKMNSMLPPIAQDGEREMSNVEPDPVLFNTTLTTRLET